MAGTKPSRYDLPGCPKGFEAMLQNGGIFEEEEGVVVLGVGKNMVRSIRYWLIATQMAQPADIGLEPTDLGRLLLAKDGLDPYLEDEATIWLLHWLIATNPEWATVNNWFFNHFHKPRFTSAEAQTAFVDYCRENIKSRFSATTVKKDVAVLMRSYVRARVTGRVPAEEALDSPLSLLGLVSYAAGEKVYRSFADLRPDLPVGIFGFAVSQIFAQRNETALPIEQLMYPKDGWPGLGTVFRLTENELIRKLELFAQDSRGVYELRETAGLHQLYLLTDDDPIEHLRSYYQTEARDAA